MSALASRPSALAIAVAIAYLLCAWAVRWAAPPPGYVAPLAPAAGLAVAALLAGGLRLWIAIWLGAFVAAYAVDRSGDGAAMAAAIATGAALQAWAGASLARRELVRDDPLMRDGRIWRLLLLAGPLACSVSATVGVAALAALGRLDSTAPSDVWLAWWSSETLGVVLLAPAFLAVWPQQERRWGDGRRVVVPLLLAAVLFFGAHLAFDRTEQRQARLDTAARFAVLVEAAADKWRATIEALEYVERLFAASDEVTPAEFDTFVAPTRRLAGFAGVGWLPRVAASQRAQFERAAAGGAPLRIVEFGADGRLVPAAERDEYFPEALFSGRAVPAVPGLDHGAFGEPRAAMERAAASGKPQGLRVDRLDRTGAPALLFFVPTYARGFDVEAAAPPVRRAALRGFVLGVIDRDAIFAPLAERASEERALLRVTGVTPGEPPKVFLDTLGDRAPVFTRDVPVGGRVWRVEMAPQRGWIDGASVAQRGLSLLLVAAALLIGVNVLGTAARAAALRRREADLSEQVAARTQALTDANRALAEREAELRSVLDLVVDAIVRIDDTGIVRYANPALRELLGYAPQEIVGRNVAMLMPEPHRSAHDGYLARYLASGEPHIIGRGREVEALARDGTRIPVHLTVSEYRDASGARYFVGQLRDLRLEKRARAEIESARTAAEEANRAKSAFLATMSHEIRTPMNAVIGLIEVLRRASLKPSQLELVDTIAQAADDLLGIIDDILDLSKIEANRLELEARPLSIERTVESACATFAARAREQGVALLSWVDPALARPVIGDAKRLRQVLLNLISNAIKFSAGRRRARVGVHVDRVEDGAVRARFSVSDTGIGMDAETVGRLFQPFMQAEAGTARRFGGSGLGLSICQRLVTMMGGRIEVESTPGQGSRFSYVLTFPLAEGAPEARPAVDLAGVRVTVSSDDRELVADLARWLASAGAVVVGAADEADVRIVDAIDISIDEALAQRGRLGEGRPPAVVLTREEFPAPRWIDPGAVGLDVYGQRRETLLRAVAIAAGRAQVELHEVETGAAVSVPSPERAAAQGAVILVADDNEINRKVIAQQLSLLGYSAEVAEDGRAALERWRAAPQRYGALLTDVHMPELDGYALARAVRAEQTRHLPIIALTANATADEERRCREAGMDAFVPKPVRLDRLSEQLARWLPPMTDAAAPAAAPAPPGSVLDLGVLRALVGSEPAVLAEILREFRRTLLAAIVEIGDAVRRGDLAALARAAHRFKSAAASVGAQTLATLCANLEDAAATGAPADLDALAAAFAQASAEADAATLAALDALAAS